MRDDGGLIPEKFILKDVPRRSRPFSDLFVCVCAFL